jgi:hypothetical protein
MIKDKVHDLTSILQFELKTDDDIGLSNTINTCLELLEVSIEELHWCASALKNPKGINI